MTDEEFLDFIRRNDGNILPTHIFAVMHHPAFRQIRDEWWFDDAVLLVALVEQTPAFLPLTVEQIDEFRFGIAKAMVKWYMTFQPHTTLRICYEYVEQHGELPQ